MRQNKLFLEMWIKIKTVLRNVKIRMKSLEFGTHFCDPEEISKTVSISSVVAALTSTTSFLVRNQLLPKLLLCLPLDWEVLHWQQLRIKFTTVEKYKSMASVLALRWGIWATLSWFMGGFCEPSTNAVQRALRPEINPVLRASQLGCWACDGNSRSLVHLCLKLR